MDINKLTDNLSAHFKHVIAKAVSIATTMNEVRITPLHLLLALCQEEGAIGAEILHTLSLKEEEILEAIPKKKSSPIAHMPELNTQAKKALEKAMLLSYEYEHTYVGTEHLLYGLISSTDPAITTLFSARNIDRSHCESQIETALETTSRFPNIDDMVTNMEHLEENLLSDSEPHPSPIPHTHKAKQKKRRNHAQTMLETYTIDLTGTDRQPSLDPVIGREKEIDRLIHILCRRTKNNPLLIGEPGVGKTAIAEGLAKRIILGNVPDILKKKKILSLDLPLLVSGTIYRGEFESRITQLIEEISAQEECILFIDEVHTVIGAGSNQGTLDAANILKPALARGKLRCIGATTIDEYQKYIVSDPALERRFQPIQVDEPTRDETVAILCGLASYYEAFHTVTLTNEAIEAAVDLSITHIHDSFLPDKAIDLVDETCASVRVAQPMNPLDIKKEHVSQELEKTKKQKEEAIATEAFNDAILHKEKIRQLEEKIRAMNEKQKQRKRDIKKVAVNKNDIINTLGRRLRIDTSILFADEWAMLQTLPERIQAHIKGQNQVIEGVTNTLQQAHLGLNHSQRPLASFLFVGSSGVGKTELAKRLAGALYHDPHSLIRLDMSEFSEGHGVSKLLGSPAGYVGHKERNRFTDDIRKRPHGVVLFDEIDKAHPDVVKLLLQILDEGTLTDSLGKKVHFNHTIIILTTNVGANFFSSTGIGFGDSTAPLMRRGLVQQKNWEEKIHTEVKEAIGMALVNRIDRVCIFEPLTHKSVEEIIETCMGNINKTLGQKKNISLKSDKHTIPMLARKTMHKDAGARYVEQEIKTLINTLLVDVLKKTPIKKRYTLTEKKGKFMLV